MVNLFTRLYLIRHAQTKFNLGNLYLGTKDISIDSIGIKQAKQLKERISNLPVDIFFTSPLQRTRQTLEIIKNKNAKVLVLEELSEIDFGVWEGLPASNQMPGGESIEEALVQVKTFLEKITSFKGKNIAVVSSGGILNLLLCALFKIKSNPLWQFRLSPASLSEVLIYPNKKVVLTLFNDTCHLEEIR